MRKLGAMGMAAALCAGLTLAAARADDGDGGDLRSLPPVKPSWWSGMFGGKKEIPEPERLPPVKAAPPRVAPASPATVQAREESALFRRLNVCDELLELADRKDDSAFREQVYQLMDRAWAVYQQRTSGAAPRSIDEAALTRPGADARRAATRESASLDQRGSQP
jgi:hypothetical protein